MLIGLKTNQRLLKHYFKRDYSFHHGEESTASKEIIIVSNTGVFKNKLETVKTLF